MPQCIAIIEDDQPTATFLANVLADAGYQTLVSVTHTTVLRLATEPRPDLFILNLMRGSVYIGIQTLAVLREHLVTSTVPVILCSANTTFLHAQRQALAQRNCLILTKPFLHHELLEVVQEALGQT